MLKPKIMTLKSLHRVAGILALWAIGACSLTPFESIDTVNNSEWAAPLVDSERSFSDMIEGFDPQAFVQINADNSVVLRYKGDFIARTSIDIFTNLQNTTFPLIDSNMVVPFILPRGVHVDSVYIKKGFFSWLIASNEPVAVRLSIPQLTRNGQPFERQFVAGFAQDTLDMAGWAMNLANDSIKIFTTARKVSDGSPVNLRGSGIFNIKDFEFAFVKGFLGTDTFDVPRDTIKIDFFERWKDGNVRFDNPKMVVTLDNSFGVPVRSVMRVGNILTNDGRTLPLISPLTAGVDVAYPTLQQVGQSKRTVVTFDKNNSNLADIISSNPIAVDYDIDGVMNPDAAAGSRVTGFITDSSAFKLQVEVEVPMLGSVRNFVVSDTLDFNLSGLDEAVKYAEFKLTTDNGMPIQVGVQGYFLAANGAVIDSLLTTENLVLKGAPVGANGLPTATQNAVTLVNMPAERLAKIKTASKIVLRYRFATTNNGATSVMLTAVQKVRVRLGVRFGYNK